MNFEIPRTFIPDPQVDIELYSLSSYSVKVQEGNKLFRETNISEGIRPNDIDRCRYRCRCRMNGLIL